MADLLSPVPKLQFFDSNGKPAAGYKLFTYSAGTSTKLATYTDSSGNTSNPNPIILDFRGEANVWIPPNVAYKYVFCPPNDTDPPSNPVWSVDNIVGSQLVTLWGGVDTGIADAYVLDFNANFTSYDDGIVIYWIPSNANTGPSTINVNGLGPVPIKNQDGGDLYLGQIRANEVALIVCRGSYFVLVTINVLPAINEQNANYTFQLSDANNIVENSSSSGYDYTIPPNSDVPFPEGTSITVIASNSGAITIKAGTGVTLNPYGNSASADVQVIGYAGTVLTKVDTDQWVQSTPSNVPANLLVAGGYIGTLTGLNSPLSPVLIARKVGGIVTIIPVESYTGTSNSTSMTLTGMPSDFRPTVNDVSIPCFGLIDNGSPKGGVATVGVDGTITFGIGVDNNTTGFTNSGSKGIGSQWCITYNRGAS